MPALSDLKSENLVTRAVEALRQFILDELLVPGAELPSQGKLAERLGVSRTVIREAMRILESQGLLEITQGKLPRVLPPNTQVVIDGLSTLMERSSATLLDVLEVRRPVEIEVAVLAAERATGEHLRQMSEANEALAKAQTIEAQILADMRFHKIVAEATGNPVFAIVLDVLAQFLFESRRKTLKQSGAKVALRHHRQLLKAIEERDLTKARQAAADGMRQTEADLKREAKQLPSASDPPGDVDATRLFTLDFNWNKEHQSNEIDRANSDIGELFACLCNKCSGRKSGVGSGASNEVALSGKQPT